MSKLFDRDKSVISRHIKKAFEEELNNEVVVAKFATTTEHGAIKGKIQTHMVDYYNLDMIISVCYRVKSNKGIIFRKTIKLINIAGRIDKELEGNEAQGIIKVINNYSNALKLLDDYDHKRIIILWLQ